MLTCTSCKKQNTIFKRNYSGERLCKRCFCKSIENRVRGTISKYKMFEPLDKIMVAVSGGKDSVALLHILTKIEKTYPAATLNAVTIDEGIKGYRNEALRLATKNCQKLGVDHVVLSFKEIYGYKLDEIVKKIQKTKEKLTPCSYCGVLRRQALNTAAREAGVNKLATAHSLDDETQTILLNIIHGDPLRTARATPLLAIVHPKLIPRAKPFCEVPEREIAFYSYLKRVEFQIIPCPYASTSLRTDIRTTLDRIEEQHAGTKFTIFRSIERIRPALKTMLKETALQNCQVCGEPTAGRICKPCQMLQELRVL